MKKTIRVVVWVLLGIFVSACGLAIAATVLSERKLLRTVDLTVAPIEVPDEEIAMTRGKYLYASRGCMECHGDDGSGRVVLDDPTGFFVRSPNITRGVGSPAEHYTVVDWVRTIRHGIKRNGHPMLVMPSEDYNQMTDEDLGAIIGYVSTLPGKTGRGAQMRVPLVVRALYVAGVVKDTDEKIDHTIPPPTAAKAAAAQGEYLAGMCRGCHGAGLAGGAIPGAPPSWPPAANLTSAPDSPFMRYSSEQFKTMMRTGKRPDGTDVNNAMPFASLKNIDDVELDTLFSFLKSLPPRAAGSH